MLRKVLRAALCGVVVVACNLATRGPEARAQAAPGCIVPLSQVEDGPVKDGGASYPFVGRVYGSGALTRCIPVPVVEADDPPYPPGYAAPPIWQLTLIEQAVGAARLHDPAAYDESLYESLYWAVEAFRAMSESSVDQLEALAWLDVVDTPGKLGTPDLATVPVPADFPDEPIASLDGRTLRIEIEVPRGSFETDEIPHILQLDTMREHAEEFSLPVERVEDPDPASPTVRLRGWFIEGLGEGGDHPLVVLLHGHGQDPFVEDPKAYGRGYRTLAYRAATAGFDVLMFSLRGQGVSEGSAEGEPADIYRALDELASGCLTLGSEPGAVPTVRRLSPSAHDTPVLLWGLSQGGRESEKLMTDNVDQSRGYDLRGAVLMSSAIDSTYYRSSLTPFQIAINAIESYNGWTPGDFESPTIDAPAEWPGVLVVHGTDDAAYSLRGAVEVFNRVSALKDMYTYVGTHGDALSPAIVPEVARHAVRFSRVMVGQEAPDDLGTKRATDVDREVTEALAR